MSSVEACYRQLYSQLEPVLGEREARASARALIEDVAGRHQPWPADVELKAEMIQHLYQLVQRMIDRDEPLAYLTGKAHFYGLELEVNPSVLIPRPETEELADRVIRDWSGWATSGNHQPSPGVPPAPPVLRVLDAGTGSGCLAIALARHLPFAALSACDISAEALSTAARNGERSGVDVNWFPFDLLQDPAPDKLRPFDLLVSNPPYVPQEQAGTLARRVRDFEPATALFAPAGDPLAFYRALAGWCRLRIGHKHRDRNGLPLPLAYLETDDQHAQGAARIWREQGFRAAVERDLSGRERFLVAWSAVE